MKNKLLIALVFLCVSSISALAQRDNSFSMGVSISPSFYEYANLNGLNNQLKLYNYPTINKSAPEFSFGIIFGDTSNAFYDLIELGEISSATPRSNNLAVSFTELRAMITFNFNLNESSTNKRKILTGPLFGFGVTNATLTITDKSEVPRTFDSSLALLNGQRTITSGNAYIINLGWGAQKSLDKRHLCFLALKAGYDIDLNDPKWQFSYTNNLANNPKTSLSGFYASLQLNFIFNIIPPIK